MRTIPYGKLYNGSLFRFPNPEYAQQHPWLPPKRLDNSGVFVKIGPSHALRVQAGMEQIVVVPALHTRCVPVKGVYDVRQHSDWWLVHGREG